MPDTALPKLIVVAGPTAVGKTAFAVSLAKHLGCEVLSADSRQCYREMLIGTARPTQQELQGIPHHFLGHRSIDEPYDVGQFEKEAIALLSKLLQQDQHAILVGGSGLYIQAVCEGLDEFPDVDPAIREKLMSEYQTSGLPILLQELASQDPDYYRQVDQANTHRVIRALEIIRATGKPFSSFRSRQAKKRPFEIVKIGLTLDRPALYRRIDQRMDAMLTAGLKAEAESLMPFKTHNALQTVGYQEIYAYLDGQYHWDEAVRMLKRNSRRYAKRQLTWFKRDPAIHWVDMSHPTKALEKALEVIK